MNVEFEINSTNDPAGSYIGWSPVPCRVRVSDPTGITGPSVSLRIGTKTTSTGGDARFRKGTSGPLSASVLLTVPRNGESVPFYMAGEYRKASINDGDVQLVARNGTTIVGSKPFMVRIRKNANTLTTAERDRFLSAFARLNAQGLGRFTDFREMHTSEGDAQAHGGPGFLPWHRIYLLDLERELQAIDRSVALPYWRFDEPADKLFSPNYIGRADFTGAVQFSSTNPLRFWTTDGVQGFDREPDFDTQNSRPHLRSESDTLDLGGPQNSYEQFRSMQGNPHGWAHTSFDGPINHPATAPRDPLFFLLHCNVDRLWAKWQEEYRRFDSSDPRAYVPSSLFPDGHNLTDSLWPWNGVTGGTRPNTAPGGELRISPCVSAPGPQPTVEQTLDYQGTHQNTGRLGFDYDDVKFS